MIAGRTNPHLNNRPRLGRISRRAFLKMAAAAGLLAGCSPIRQPDAAPTAVPVPTNAPKVVTKTLGKVVRARHTGVWDGETLVPEAIRQMLDVSIAKLTSIENAGKAWAALFDPGERIAIKVNTIRSSDYWTHVPLVMAVTECLQDAGVPAEQIVIFDRATRELEDAGFPVNQDGPGVRCYGTDGNNTPGWTLMDTDIMLSDILLNCDALINIPVLKAHSIAGCTFAMKNHYGTFNKPGRFHTRIEAIADLNALPPIRDRTRLIIGDALTICTFGWSRAVTGDSILMSFDPVAHDVVGLQVLNQAMESGGVVLSQAASIASVWLGRAAELGLGVNEPDAIKWTQLTLG